MLQIAIQDSDGHPIHRMVLGDQPLSFGRDPQSSVSLAEINISRQHAVIEPRGRFHVIRDLGSRNGTWVNGQPLDTHILQDGDVIGIGNYRLVVRTVDEPDAEFQEAANTQIIDALFEFDASPDSVHTQRIRPDEGLRAYGGDAEHDSRWIRLQEITEGFLHVESPDVLQRRVLEVVLNECRAERAALLLKDGVHGFRLAAALTHHVDRPQASFAIHRGVLRAVESEGVGLLTEDASLDERFDPAHGREAGRVFSVICVPLLSRAGIRGAIYLDRTETAEPFSPSDLAFVTIVANHVAVSLANASLFSDILAEKQRVKAIIDNLYDGIIITDDALRIERFNIAAMRMLVKRGTNLVGRNFRDLLARLTESFDEEAFLDSVDANESFKLVVPDGDTLRAYHILISPYPRGPGEAPGLLFAVRDATGFVTLENLKSDFIRAASHKLRTPLAVALGNVELLRSQISGGEIGVDDAERQAGNIEESLRRLEGLVERFVEFSELDKQPDRLRQVDLKQTLSLAWSGLSCAARERDVRLELDVPERLPEVTGAPDRLVQCFSHLFDNAIQHSPPGARITARCDGSDGRVAVSISDEGPGIAPEQWPFVFAGFHQENPAAHDSRRAGLGLTIVRRILHQYGATIEGSSIDPDSGCGCRFVIRFPRDLHSVRPNVYLETDFIPELTLA